MFDELDRLRTDPQLQELLAHYARLGEPDREIWHPRKDDDQGKLHGQLIAFSWVELKVGQVPTSYRITLLGRRALREIECPESAMPEIAAA